MDLVKSLRAGSFDKTVTDNTSFVSPHKWHEHFSSLLAPPVCTAEPGNSALGEHAADTNSMTESDMAEFVAQNSADFKTDIDFKLSR